jgi:aspartate-semialdehyde dehydrogenase
VSGRVPVAILGASGYVGQQFSRLLADHPRYEPTVFTGSPGSGVRRLAEIWRLAEPMPAVLDPVRVRPMGAAAIARTGVRLAFGALPSGSAKLLESGLRRRGVHVFSNSADHRNTPGSPLLIPEVNPDHAELLGRPGGTVLVTNPNCTATGLALALAPVLGRLRPRRIFVTSYQALSGAGLGGVSGLAIQDNVIPFVRGEEEKVESETRRLLGRVQGRRIWPESAAVIAQCARVGVRDGHLLAVTVEARSTPSIGELLEAWSSFRPLERLGLPTAPREPVVVRDEEDRPQPLLDRWAGAPERARGMSVVLGRIRWSAPFLRFFALSHNAVRGAAGGSLLNAEFLEAVGRLPGLGRRSP